MAIKEKPGTALERAVYDFASRLDPNVKVFFNRYMPDRDTGTLRQCDVWIDAKIGGHYAVSILISCKDHGRKLNIGDIGTFLEEIRSVGADKGVIYSKRGFYKPAITKATRNNISCCRLYKDEPGELPLSIAITMFLLRPLIGIKIESVGEPSRSLINSDVLKIKCNESNSEDILDFLIGKFKENCKLKWSESCLNRTLPQEWNMVYDVTPNAEGVAYKITLAGSWKIFRGKSNAILLNGSYSITEGDYLGNMTGPWIDCWGLDPGPGWELNDGDSYLSANTILILTSLSEIRSALLDRFGSIPLFT